MSEKEREREKSCDWVNCCSSIHWPIQCYLVAANAAVVVIVVVVVLVVTVVIVVVVVFVSDQLSPKTKRLDASFNLNFLKRC